MERFSEEYIEAKPTQQAQAVPVLDHFDSPPKDVLVDPDSNGVRRLRLIEEARRNRLRMEEQQRGALHNARKDIEMKMSTPQKTTNSEQEPKPKKRRNRGGRNRGSQGGDVIAEQFAVSQAQPESAGPSRQQVDSQGQSLQQLPASNSLDGEILRQAARALGRRSRNPLGQILAPESQGLRHSPGSGLNLQDSYAPLRAGPQNVPPELALLHARASTGGVNGRRSSRAASGEHTQHPSFSTRTSWAPLSPWTPHGPAAVSSNIITQSDEDSHRRGPPYIDPTRAVEAERLGQTQNSHNDPSLQEEVAWERDTLWRILRQQLGVGDLQIRALLESERNRDRVIEWEFV
ncbi:hypothetical protein AYO21_02758 [Fonsecaea monophora]|uniref:Uncharacterized protein n=1 Tax=Fonsecaea monophora TaxID=254056 RepID=A0A177FJ23_9EURO|nr:hypothetical protein AYO21_02758 [Fonsecaea monophora]KAH0836118.1 hypothetical protein FOPE_04403 [Fonsecaea pedrosoi]OAG43139.1 hypothetical protein AYO21_02758 [Fonsecaea monophora]